MNYRALGLACALAKQPVVDRRRGIAPSDSGVIGDGSLPFAGIAIGQIVFQLRRAKRWLMKPPRPCANLYPVSTTLGRAIQVCLVSAWAVGLSSAHFA